MIWIYEYEWATIIIYIEHQHAEADPSSNFLEIVLYQEAYTIRRDTIIQLNLLSLNSRNLKVNRKMRGWYSENKEDHILIPLIEERFG